MATFRRGGGSSLKLVVVLGAAASLVGRSEDYHLSYDVSDIQFDSNNNK